MNVLKRSQTDRVLFGVCGGLGQTLRVDADLVRAAWILFGAWGGIGLVPYAAAILLLPEADVPAGFQPAPRRTRNLGLAFIAGAVVLLFLALGLPLLPVPGLLFFAAWKFLVPILLLVVGALLVWPKLRERAGLTPERRFFRSSTERLLAGVCGGLGARLGVDPNLVRLAAVLLAFATAGAAAFAYLLVVVLVPEEGTGRAESEPESQGPLAGAPPAGAPSDQVAPQDRR